MKHVFFPFVLLLLLANTAFAQTLRPLPDGAYPTSATDVIADIPPTTYKVNARVSNSTQDAFTIAVTTNGSYESDMPMARLEGNIFARQDREGMWITPSRVFVVMQPNGVMEFYLAKDLEVNTELKQAIAIAADGAKFGELRKAAKERGEAFKFGEYNAKLVKANEALKQKAIADAAAAEAAAEAKRIAAEKARADRAALDAAAAEQAKADAAKAKAAEANVDICASLSRYHKMAATNFKEIQGSLNAEETELEEEDVFNTSEKCPLLNRGLIIPTWRDGIKKVQFATNFQSTEDADAHLALLRSKLDACYKSKGGFTATVDSEIYFYKSATVTMELMRVTDYGDDGVEYKVLIQITRK